MWPTERRDTLKPSLKLTAKRSLFIKRPRAIKSLLSGKNKKKYESEDEDNFGIVIVNELTPIQMPNLDLEEIFEGRKRFSKEEWIDLLLRSIGMEPTQLHEREKWHLLERLVPLVENNYNLCELGPRYTGKSHVYKEISPNSILVSSGQTTVANLFYNMGRRQVGLVGNWDVVAFDEVAGINFKDKDGIEAINGNGKFNKVGTVAKSTTDSISNAVNYFKANAQHISSMINMDNTDFMMDIRDLQGQGAAEDLSLSTLIAMTSAALKKPVLTQLAILGGISIGGTINPIEELANVLQVAHDAGANKILLPSNAKKQIVDVPDDLFVTFQIIFYNSQEDAVFKALGIE